jgi:hypothetical protein
VGYNEDSRKVDSKKIVGIFNYFVTKFYAVDYELFYYICEHPGEASTSDIYQNIQAAVYNWYLDNMAYYY